MDGKPCKQLGAVNSPLAATLLQKMDFPNQPVRFCQCEGAGDVASLTASIRSSDVAKVLEPKQQGMNNRPAHAIPLLAVHSVLRA